MKNAMIATMTTAAITPTIMPEDVPLAPLSGVGVVVGVAVGVDVVLTFSKGSA